MGAQKGDSLTNEDRTEQDATLVSFAKRLRVIRETAGISQDMLDARACLHKGVVSQFECARRPAPGLFTLLRLADSLRVEPGVLLDALPVPRRTATTERTLSLIEANPGIATQTIAEDLKITRSYARRLMRRLIASRAIRLDDGGWVTIEDTPNGSTDSAQAASLHAVEA